MKVNKFRAWDVENKQMIDADSLAFDFYEPLCDQLRDSDEIKFMQYTGLKDKNSVEIYQGDLFDDGIEISIIQWDDTCASFVAFDGTENHQLGDYTSIVKIIGNIHNNPELLKADL